ncbi:MAG: WG repeat-containing protein [Deltaproteobacteria bacterium]|nr:WG repeat-containing protein [Deltaproteobacteria bacterium]
MAEGLAAVKLEGRWDFTDRQGRMVTSRRFDGAYQFSEGLARVKKDEKWGYIDRTGKWSSSRNSQGEWRDFLRGWLQFGFPKKAVIKREILVLSTVKETWRSRPGLTCATLRKGLRTNFPGFPKG